MDGHLSRVEEGWRSPDEPSEGRGGTGNPQRKRGTDSGELRTQPGTPRNRSRELVMVRGAKERATMGLGRKSQ